MTTPSDYDLPRQLRTLTVRPELRLSDITVLLALLALVRTHDGVMGELQRVLNAQEGRSTAPEARRVLERMEKHVTAKTRVARSRLAHAVQQYRQNALAGGGVDATR